MEFLVSKGITDSYFEKFKKILSVDVAIVGGGPSGLVAAYYLAKSGVHTALFERKLAPGGGMWGGAMLFNSIIIQQDAKAILDELEIPYNLYTDNLLVVDSVTATSALIYHATKAGTTIMNGMTVEDVVLREGKVCGIVVNWAPVQRERLHVDPLIVTAKAVIDGTGHDCEVARTLERKNNVTLNTPTGKITGEMSLSIEEAETATLANSREIYPGLYVSGMASNGVFGNFRMGPIFGGMLLSGRKVAQLIETAIRNNSDDE